MVVGGRPRQKSKRSYNNRRLKVAMITNARSDYTTIYPVMRLAVDDADLDVRIICGGMHLPRKFGSTWRQLIKDGLRIDATVRYFVGGDSGLDTARSMGKGAAAFGRVLNDITPDLVVVSGDRIENLAVYSATMALNLPVAHLCGGDITKGSRDNQIRHMMTKLSHLHFVSMEEHARRVLQMGEEPWRVTISGDAAIDTICALQPMSRRELWGKERVPESRGFCLCTFHPSTLGDEDDELQFGNVLDFLGRTELVPVIVYPNIDPGHDRMIDRITAFKKVRPDAVIRRNFPREVYYSLMAHAEFQIGNTSSGIWEAPSFKLPSINVGNRQAGRVRAGNVVDISGLDPAEFDRALRIIRSTAFRRRLKSVRNPYGDGKAAPRIIARIKEAPKGQKLLVKQFIDVPGVRLAGRRRP